MSRISAAYSGWGGFGITDKQTGSDLEVLLGDMNGQTAVSIYHHTRSFLIFTSAMMGNILENEADSLMGVLKNEFGIVRQTT